jgi:peptidoglycan biosynthesis protein MviN/MurJ (putative lipid II flippase)
MTKQDLLTTVERNFIEHWSRRRWQLLRSWIATGAILWGGFMAYFTLSERYQRGELSGTALVLYVGMFLVGGCIFGVAMWALGELRFRRMVAKGRQANRDGEG